MILNINITSGCGLNKRGVIVYNMVVYCNM